MSKFTVNVEHKPVINAEVLIPANLMDERLRALPVTWRKKKLNDYYFYCPSWDDWRKIIEYLQPKVPKYISERRDCEFMACWFYVHVCEDFEINTMAMAEGWVDFRDGKGKQRHAWNIFTDGELFYQLESQTGEVFDIDNPDYAFDEIIIG